MSDNIVISFSNKDRAFVEALSAQLDLQLSRYRTVRSDKAGDGRPRVWIYPQQTDGSRHIIEIHRQLEQALAVIVVLSDHSAASRWVLEEIQVAWNANKLIIPIVIGDRAVIKQRDVGKLLSTRTWIYAEELDSATVTASIVNTLAELGKISKADIGNRYRHKRQLTTRPTGGFFEAARDDNEQLFVVKEVATGDREVLRELDAKIARLQQLRNPALPLIEDYLQEEGRRYIVWEEVPGRHLGDVLAAQKDQPLAWTDIQLWISDALTTLAFLHQAKVLHLGLKPQNFKRTRDGQIKLLDIGLDRRPAGVAGVGTTDPYLAPELLDERDPSPRSDLYAFGAVLYTLLTGDTQPSPLKHPVARRNRAVPEHVSQAISRAMSADPAQRFRSASEFLVALEGSQAPIGTQPKLPAWLMPAGAAALVGLLMLVLFVPGWLREMQGASAPTAEAPAMALPTSAPVAAVAVATGVAGGAQSETMVPVASSNAPPTRLPNSLEPVLAMMGYKPTDGQILEINSEIRPNLIEAANGFAGSVGLESNTGDFVFHATIDWGDADDYCQVYFRGSQTGDYAVGISQKNTVSFQRQDAGEFVYVSESAQINFNSDTNQLVIHADRDEYQVYVNGQQSFLPPITDDAHLTGGMSLVAWSPDGANVQPTCTFRDVWVWAPDVPAAVTAPEPTAIPLPASFEAVMALVRQDGENARVFAPQDGVTLEELPEPVTITLDSDDNRYGVNKLSSDSPDFVLHANVAWGDVGDICQLNFRENERGFFAVGIRPYGNVYAGRWENNLWNPLYYEASTALKTKSGETNNLILVVSGTKIQLYINNQLALDLTNDWYERGAVGLVAYDFVDPNAEPRPSCTFSDVWVWAPDGL